MNKFIRFINQRAARAVANQFTSRNAIATALAKSKYPIPVIIVCFNNGPYLRNMVAQLLRRSICPIIIDNKSTEIGTLTVLSDAEEMGVEVVRAPRNLGHLVGFLDPVYKILPNTFAYTDPDLQFHPQLPDDFLNELAEVADFYKCYKAGMAIDISSFGELKKWTASTTSKYPFSFHKEHDILDWERQYWTMPLKHERLEVYAAQIDTTFAVYQKKHFCNGDFTRGVRVAGNFATCHLPWHPHLELLSEAEQIRYLKEKKVGFRPVPIA